MTNSHYNDDTEALLKGTFMCPCILFNAALKGIRAFTEQLQVHLLRFENILVCLLCCIASIHRIEQAVQQSSPTSAMYRHLHSRLLLFVWFCSKGKLNNETFVIIYSLSSCLKPVWVSVELNVFLFILSQISCLCSAGEKKTHTGVI